MIERFLERTFSLSQHNTTVKAEVIAGLTTFAAMSYILNALNSFDRSSKDQHNK